MQRKNAQDMNHRLRNTVSSHLSGKSLIGIKTKTEKIHIFMKIVRFSSNAFQNKQPQYTVKHENLAA